MKSTIRCQCGAEIEITDQLDADLRLIADHQAAEIERLKQAIREAIEISDTGSERHRAAFDPHGAGEVPAGWRVAEKMRETLVDAMGVKT